MLLLLLPLLSGGLTLCVGQTASLTQTTVQSLLTQPVHATAVLPTADDAHNNVAVLLTAVQSTRALNETTLAPVLNKLHDIIQGIQPDAMFSLSLKNYTRV